MADIAAGSLTAQRAFMHAQFDAMRVPVKYANVIADPQGYKIPYEGVEFHRIRLINPTNGSKYTQPPGEMHVYFSPGFDPVAPLMVITEGEKKAICASYHWGVPVIGIGGKDCWHAKGSYELHEELASAVSLVPPGARVIVVPDGDVHHRLDVKASYGSMVAAIRKARPDLEVIVKELPEASPRLGLDDWMVAGERTRTLDDLMGLPGIESLPRMKNDLLAQAEYAYNISKTGAKTLLPSEYNAGLYIARAFDYRLDSSLGPIEMDTEGRWKRLTDVSVVEALQCAQRDLLTRFTMTHARGAVSRILRDNPSNVLGDLLRSYRWDALKRVERLFYDYIKADAAHDPRYLREAATAFLTGLVARALEPGIKHDLMVVLVGAQGTFKSTALRILAGGEDFYAEVTHVNNIDDLKRIGQRVWVMDIAEMHSYNRLEISQVKGWLSAPVDTFVDKFDKHPTHKPKGYVAVGSTNEQGFLRDSTGERRYLPVRVTGVDIEALKRDRDQLLAEAVIMFLKHGIMHTVAGAEREQAKHKVKYGWTDALEQSLDTHVQGRKLPTVDGRPMVTMQWVLDRLERGSERFVKEIAGSMRMLGWEDANGLKRNTSVIRITASMHQASEFFKLVDGNMPRQARYWTLKRGGVNRLKSQPVQT